MRTEAENPTSGSGSILRATSNGDADAVRALLAGGADVDQIGRGGHTALMVAAIFDHVEIARLLLDAGADVRLQDNLGLTAKEWAERRGSWEVGQLISRSSAAESAPSRVSPPAPRAFQPGFSTGAAQHEVSEDSAQSSESENVATGSSTDVPWPHVDDEDASFSKPGSIATESSVAAATPRPDDGVHYASEADNTTAQSDTVRWKKFHQQIMATQERRKAEESRREEPPILPEQRPVSTWSAIAATQRETEDSPTAATSEPSEPSQEAPAAVTERGPLATLFSTPATQHETEESQTTTTIPIAQGDAGPSVGAHPLVAAQSVIKESRREVEREIPTAIPAVVAEPPIAPPQREPRPTAAQLARIATTIEYLRILDDSDREDEVPVRADFWPEVPVRSEVLDETVKRPQSSVSASAYSSRSEVVRDERDATLERIPAQLFPARSTAELSPDESYDLAPLKRCPECNTTYRNELLMYCAYDATKLVGADEPVFKDAETNDRSKQTLWALVAITAVLGVFLGYLINNYRSRERESAPVASRSAQPQPETLNKEPPLVLGALSGTEVDLPEPEYPARAKAEGVSGPVTVRVQVNQNGRVVQVRSSGGDWRLRAAAVAAAQKARFSPEKLAGLGRVVSGSITYNFVPQTEAPTATGPQSPTETGSPSANEASPATGSPVDNAAVNYPQVGGPLAGAEMNLPQPDYPARAKSNGIFGTITVVVRVNRAGKVISWRTLEGDSQLRTAALKAARKATFSPEKLPGNGEVVGTITYNFKP